MPGLLITPSVLQFLDVEPGVTQTATVTIKNTDLRTRTLRLRIPKTKYYSIHGWTNRPLAVGLETTFKVVFEGGRLEEARELILDKVVVQCEAGDVELLLKALPPCAELTVSGDLNFGLVPIESKASRRITLRNGGTAPASFRLEATLGGSVAFDPPGGAGTVPPGSEVHVGVSLTVEAAGAVSGDVLMHVVGGRRESLPVEPKKLSLSATGVRHTFELVDAQGVIQSEVDFGAKYYGEEVTRTFLLFNNGPVESTYLFTHGTPSEIKAKIDEAEGGGNTVDADDPYAGFMQTAKHRVRSRASNSNPFTVSPSTGVMSPYSKTAITMVFRPEANAAPKGFSVLAPDSDKTTKSYEYMGLVELFGLSHKIKLPIRADAVVAGLRLDPPALDFGDVTTNSYADQLVMARNTNSKIGLKFQFDKAGPYFSVEPPSGTIPGGQSQQLLVRYAPKAMGNHAATLPLKVFGAAGRQVQSASLHLAGSSLRLGSKGGLVGGTDKLSSDFTRPKQFLDSEKVFGSKVDALKKSTRRGLPLWEQPHLTTAIGELPSIGNRDALSMDEIKAKTAHRDHYAAVISSKRTAKVAAPLKRHISDDDINLGLDTRSGLAPHEPKMPKVVDPLWTVGVADEGRPHMQRSVPTAELDAIPIYADKPGDAAEKAVCTRELMRDELSSLAMGPKVMEFGFVAVGSTSTQYAMFVNTLSRPLHVVIDAKSVPELAKSCATSQVIPPFAKAKFAIDFNSFDVMRFDKKVEYCINSSHVLSFLATADVVPVSVNLSSEELHFEFSTDNWDDHIDNVLTMDNPNKFPIEFSLSSDSATFSVTPASSTIKPKSSGEACVRWAPPLDGSLSGKQAAELTLSLVGGDAPRVIALTGMMPDGRLTFKEKAVDAGVVPCGVPQLMRVQVRNGGQRDTSFRVVENRVLTVSPDKDSVAAEGTVDLEVSWVCRSPGIVETVLELAVQGGKPIRLPFKAEGVMPCVELMQDEFDFGSIFIGNRKRMPFTLVNTTPIVAMVTVDLRAHPELQLVLPKTNWSASEYEACPLQRMGPDGETRSGRSSLSGASRGARRDSTLGDGFATDGAVFHVSLNAGATLEMELAFRPKEAKVEAAELVIHTLTNGVGSVPPIRRAVSMEGAMPAITISRTAIDFGTNIVIQSNQIKPPYSKDICIMNNAADGEPLTISFGKPVCVDENGRPVMGIFDVQPCTAVVVVGEMVGVDVTFCPRDARKYEATVPVFLGEATDENGVEREAYLTIELAGLGQFPRLTFDVRECVLPPVPLGIPSRAEFFIMNNGYDNLELRYRLPADNDHLPMTIEFPEGNLIGLAKERLPVVITFCCPKPLSFTANIEFMDENGKRFSMPVTATADNCLLTHQEFLKANATELVIESDDANPITLATPEGVEYLLPDTSLSLGPLDTSRALSRFLNATTCKGPLEDLIKQLVLTRGKLAIELVELLSGKPVPAAKQGSRAGNKKEAAEQLLSTLDGLLVFLKSHGALLNAVKPEMLLKFEDFDRILSARTNKAVTLEEVDAIDVWHEVENDFANVSLQAWNAVVQQMFKVFVLGRVNLKGFHSLPGLDTTGVAPPPDDSILNSNLYSMPEAVLLAWLSIHYKREYPDKAERVTNFDEDLRSGHVLFSVLVGHWPGVASKKVLLKWGDDDALSNNETIARVMLDLNLPFEVSPAELSSPNAREMLVLVLYLYQTLPQFVPKTTITFDGRLGDVSTKDLELSNPSKRAISYSVRLEGHPDFSTESATVRIEPKGTARLRIKCNPTTTKPVTSRIVLQSKRDGGGANAATLVFLLQSKVNTRAPLKRVRAEGPLYEMQQFEFAVSNPFPVDCDFVVTMLHEPAEPLPPPEVPKKGRGSPNGAKAAPAVPEAPKPRIWPNAFGLDKQRVRIKAGSSDKLRGFFLPFTMGTQYCTVVIRDKEQGEFVYELVGEPSLPAPLIETTGVVALEAAHTYEMVVPWANAGLEHARATFLDKHPLAKDKAQAALLKSDATRPTAIEYSLSQSNSLLACAKTVTLAAAGNQPVGANRGPNDGSGDPPASPDVVFPSARGKGGGGSHTSEKPCGGAANVIKLVLKPIGTGVYPARLLLTSDVDTRVFDLELTAQTMTREFSLEFAVAVRQSVQQEIPLVNTSGSAMSVQATLDGKGFSGAKEVSVPAGATVNYALTFKPSAPGDIRGSLELRIPATGEKNVYRLLGQASAPLSEGHIIIECTARQPKAASLPVPNVVGGSTPVEYQVLSDLGVVSGPQTLKCTGALAKYTLTAAPAKSGTYIGTVTFKEPGGNLAWFVVEVRASEPKEVCSIAATAQVHRAVAIKLPVRNPTSEPVTMTVSYSHPDVLLGPRTIELPVSAAAADAEFFYAPLKPGAGPGKISLCSDALGEYVFLLNLTATPDDPVALPELSAELGGRRAQHTVRVDNPLGRTTVLHASSSARAFRVTPESTTVPPHGTAELRVEYVPCAIGTLEEASVTVDGGDAGVWAWRCSGRGVLPEPAEPASLSCVVGESHTGRLAWASPFGAPVGVVVAASTSGPELELMMTEAQRTTTVPPGGSLSLPVHFSPCSLAVARAEVTVTVSDAPCSDGAGQPQPPLVWRLPVAGYAEARQDKRAAAFSFKCRARGTVEKSLEVVLHGLAGLLPDDEFTHELLIPADAKPHLEGTGVLSVEPVDVKPASPEQPLVFALRFAPTYAFSAELELLVTKLTGGRWRFPMKLAATESDLDGTIVVDASMDTASCAPLYLFARGDEPQAYAAVFTDETPLSFTVRPERGMLRPRGEEDVPEGQALFGASEPAVGLDVTRAPLWVTYTCRDFGKVLKGRLLVTTPNGKYTFDVVGRQPAYAPPTVAQMPVSVDSRLSPEMAARLAAAKVSKKENAVAANIKDVAATSKRLAGSPSKR